MPQNVSSPSQLDLERYAQELIRIPGAIQPYAALLLLSVDNLEVISRSANVAAMLGVTLPPGQTLDRALNNADGKAIMRLLHDWSASKDNALSASATLRDQRFHLSGRRTHQGLLVELEPDDTIPAITRDALYPRLQTLLDDVETANGAEAALQLATRELRRLTGFDRVAAYRFDSEGHGTVVAEDGTGVLPSCLGHRFPAYDIPPQARELYRQNRIQLIPDAHYIPVPLEPACIGPKGEAVDLTHAKWRSVPPAHLECMRHMGTGSSMSVSLVVDGQLWGLIFCHSADPKLVAPRIRAASEFLGRIVAHHIDTHERIAEHAHRFKLKKIEIELVKLLSNADSLIDCYARQSSAWTRLFNADGAALIWQDKVHTIGQTPTEAQIRQIAKWLRDNNVDQFYLTDRLSLQWPDAAAFADVASGLAAALIADTHHAYLMWFRPEVVRTVQRRGDSHTSVDPASGRLHPRQSFELWQEELRGRAEPWRLSELDALADFRTLVKALSSLLPSSP